jgi:hypothetical protein
MISFVDLDAWRTRIPERIATPNFVPQGLVGESHLFCKNANV